MSIQPHWIQIGIDWTELAVEAKIRRTSSASTATQTPVLIASTDDRGKAEKKLKAVITHPPGGDHLLVVPKVHPMTPVIWVLEGGRLIWKPAPLTRQVSDVERRKIDDEVLGLERSAQDCPYYWNGRPCPDKKTKCDFLHNNQRYPPKTRTSSNAAAAAAQPQTDRGRGRGRGRGGGAGRGRGRGGGGPQSFNQTNSTAVTQSANDGDEQDWDELPIP